MTKPTSLQEHQYPGTPPYTGFSEELALQLTDAGLPCKPYPRPFLGAIVDLPATQKVDCNEVAVAYFGHRSSWLVQGGDQWDRYWPLIERNSTDRLYQLHGSEVAVSRIVTTALPVLIERSHYIVMHEPRATCRCCGTHRAEHRPTLPLGTCFHCWLACRFNPDWTSRPCQLK